MAISNKQNVTTRVDVNRPLTYEEGDTNFVEIRNVIDDAHANEQNLEDHQNSADPHPQYATDQDLTDHENATDPHPGYVLEDELGSNSVSTSTGDQTLVEALDQRWIHFSTVSDMDSASNLSVGDRVRTSGYTSSGDGGGNDYEIVAAGTGTDDGGSFIDLSGSGLQAKGLFSNYIDIKHFGAKGDGTSDSASISNAFQFACDSGLEVNPSPGTYGIDSTISWNVTGPFALNGPRSAIFSAMSTLPVDAKVIQPIKEEAVPTKSFTWLGVTIDGRNQPARDVGAPDLLYVAGPNLSPVVIANAKFICNDERPDNAGDSCLFVAEAEDYYIYKNEFIGAIDAGIYISGNPTETAGSRAIIEGNIFKDCVVGVISKRSFKEHIISGNIASRCNVGIAMGGEADGDKLPGSKATVTGNFVVRCKRGIIIRKSDETVVVGNRVEDYAIDRDGLAALDYGIWLHGSSRCIVANNIVTRVDAPLVSNAPAIRLLSWTYDGTTYSANNNNISNNEIVDTSDGVVEAGSSASNNGNHVLHNRVIGVPNSNRVILNGVDSISVTLDSVTGREITTYGTSGSAIISSSNKFTESDGGLLFQYGAGSADVIQWIVGDSENAAVARVAYSNASDTWTWRAGGSGVVFTVSDIGPTVPTSTVAGLPAGGTAAIRYASDGRKNGEGAGAGTGVLVFFDGSNWIAVDSGQTVTS